MQMQQRGSKWINAVLVGTALLVQAGLAAADPPSRVARVGYVNGPVSFSPAGEDEWVLASLNRPLVTGDRLWADAGARVELQIGTAAIRLAEATSVTLLNLDDRVAQFQLTQGTLNVRVRRVDRDQGIEIDTPNLAYVIRRPGHYRISVDPNGQATQVSARDGEAVVYGEGASYAIGNGRSYRFVGTGLSDYENLAFSGGDEFDRWALERDRSYDNSSSARYVSRDVIGAQDLDAYGTWRAVPEYGNVWMPTRVSSDWAPYRDGRWAWVDPWGWTWVDDAPWGFAVSHYGRWASIGGGWGWIPGPVAARAVYAPALVAFIGGGNFQVAISSGSVGAVGWFPLGPRDVYRPAYSVSRTYFNNVNVTNTVINTTNITNVYNNRNITNVTYANQQVQGAVITVPTTAFVQSQPVARAALRVPHDTLARAVVAPLAAVAPIDVSVRGAAAQGPKPPAQVLERPVIAKSAPPPAPIAFAARGHNTASEPGKPIDLSPQAAARSTASAAPGPKVAVIAPNRNSGPVAAPPPQAAKEDSRGNARGRTEPVTSAPLAQPKPSTQTPAPLPPVQRGQASPPPPLQANAPSQVAPEQRNRPDGRSLPPAPVAAPPVPRPPQAIAPAPVQAPPEQRGKPEMRSPPPTQVASPPVTRPPQAIAPLPVQAPPEQRGKQEMRSPPPTPVASPPVTRPPQAIAPAPVQAPVAAPPIPRAPAEQQRVRSEPAAAAKLVPSGPAPTAPVVRAPVAIPDAAPSPKGENRGNEPRPPGVRKGNDAGKGDDEPKGK